MSQFDATTSPHRGIGPVGAVSRLVVGLTSLGAAALLDETDAVHWLTGLVGLPILTLIVMTALRRGRPDADWTGPEGHLVNTAIAVVIFVVSPPTALVFYGTAMVLAAARRYAGCELLAFSNAILQRNDEIGCPVFSPIDAIENHRRKR
ncbi:MAG: hypothetical protein R3249_07385 [Nitriliruptorales bacterium]|nr:hypothetical protein [Nitriliruptorales bacterium]